MGWLAQYLISTVHRSDVEDSHLKANCHVVFRSEALFFTHYASLKCGVFTLPHRDCLKFTVNTISMMSMFIFPQARTHSVHLMHPLADTHVYSMDLNSLKDLIIYMRND